MVIFWSLLFVILFVKLSKEPSKKGKKRVIKTKKNRFLILSVVLIFVLMLILLVNRSFPYFLYGPFGFGYDMGIYKHVFERIFTISDVFSSTVDIFPSFLAYLFNVFNVPISFFLYHSYIAFSVLIVVPLYFLTKEYFGKYSGMVAIVLFTISYVQVTASEFYLYKAILGSILMLSAFYFYGKKSYWFYPFAFLLAITQMPQILLLGVGVAVAAIFGGKKDLKFNFVGFLVLAFGLGALLFFRANYFFGAFQVIVSSFDGSAAPGETTSGLFMTLEAYLHWSYVSLILGVLGFILSLKNKQARVLQASLLFVGIIVFFKLFFENRFIFEFDLLLIPFSAYAIVYFIEELLEKVYVKIIVGVLLIAISGSVSYWYYTTTYSALSVYEVWAIDVINDLDDAEYVFVTDTLYAPWMYGYVNKETLAPGIFESVWDFDQWVDYNSADDEKKVEMLLDISSEYGKYYLFLGKIDEKPPLHEVSDKINREFMVNGVVIYEVLP